jgi:hypothetical protein
MKPLTPYISIIQQTIDVMVCSIEIPDNDYSEWLLSIRDEIAKDFLVLLGDKSKVIGWRFRCANPDGNFTVLLSLLNETFKPLLETFPKYVFEVGNPYPLTDRNCLEIKFRYKL